MVEEANYSGKITDLNRRSLTYYLADMNHPLLTREEEQVLFRQYVQAKDSGKISRSIALRHLIAERNLRFVVSEAKKHRRELSLPDAISYGNEGLMRAIDHFDYRRGFRFISYASWWIKQAIVKAMSEENNQIHIPRNVLEISSKLKRLKHEHSNGIPRHKLKKLGSLERLDDVPVSFTSTSAPAGSGDYMTLEDRLESDADLNLETEYEERRSLLKEYFGKALERLKPQQSEVIILRYGLNGHGPMTLEEVGDKMKVSRERVRQVEQVALRKLKMIAHSNVNLSQAFSEIYAQM